MRTHGIEVAQYDEPGLKTVDGVADVGFALSAWFVDPGRNTIGQIRLAGKDQDRSMTCSQAPRTSRTRRRPQPLGLTAEC